MKSYLKKLKATQEKVDLRERQKSKKAAAEEEMGANAAIAFDKDASEGKKKGIAMDRNGGKPARAQVNTSVIQRTVNRIISNKKRRSSGTSDASSTKRKKRQVRTHDTSQSLRVATILNCREPM